MCAKRKAYLIERVDVADDPTRIADDLQYAAADQSHGESDEATGQQRLHQEAEKTEGEESQEDGIGRQRRAIGIVGLTEGTGIESTLVAVVGDGGVVGCRRCTLNQAEGIHGAN